MKRQRNRSAYSEQVPRRRHSLAIVPFLARPGLAAFIESIAKGRFGEFLASESQRSMSPSA